MGEDSQKSVVSTLFKFARVRAAHQPHVWCAYLFQADLLADENVWDLNMKYHQIHE